jgi:hypothetical protein
MAVHPDLGMPPDPVSSGDEIAVTYHHGLESFMAAGFTRQEAFELIQIQFGAFWAAWCHRSVEQGDDGDSDE